MCAKIVFIALAVIALAVYVGAGIYVFGSSDLRAAGQAAVVVIITSALCLAGAKLAHRLGDWKISANPLDWLPRKGGKRT